MEIHTYPEMNQKIKDILRLGDDPMCLYAAARIEELETLLAAAVFMKDSLIPIVGEENMRRELPWETSTAKGASQEAGATAAQDTLMPAT